jgi:CRISPR system Cascade subunit CasC
MVASGAHASRRRAGRGLEAPVQRNILPVLNSFAHKEDVELVASKIVEVDPEISPEDALKMSEKVLTTAGITVKTKEKKKKDQESETIPEAQALFFMSTKQAENMAKIAIDGDYDKKKAKAILNSGNGIEISLFGRMVAESPDYNVDASSQVAHAISTHKVDNEYDFYTALDEKNTEDESGAGMMGTIEFNSSTLYRYATVAVHDLAKQIDDTVVLSKAVEGFVRAFIMSLPSGKQNTFANRTVPYSVMIVVRQDQPVSLVGAFESPVIPDKVSGGYNEASAKRMIEYEESTRDFVDAPVKTILVGKGLDVLGAAEDIRTAMSELREYIEKEY